MLAARLLGSWNDPDAGARVPFYLEDALATSHTVRGFDTFRFQPFHSWRFFDVGHSSEGTRLYLRFTPSF